MVTPQLIRELADGRFHSGESLAHRFGISRTAVWKQVQKIGQIWGLKIHAVRGKGYQLAEPLDLLDEEIILKGLDPAVQQLIDALEIHTVLDSTNRYLMEKILAGSTERRICLAEQQTDGQGRRGRNWFSPFAGNIYLSISWRFERPPYQLAGLSLAMGVVATETLHRAGFEHIGLKWPNDLVTDRGKLGGLLLQMNGENEGPSNVVAGIGINVKMPSAAAQQIDQAWTDLHTLGKPPSRSELAANLINAGVQGMALYEKQGLEPFLSSWRKFDYYRDREVVLLRGDEKIYGRSIGISEDGALLLDTGNGVERFHGGEISLRSR